MTGRFIAMAFNRLWRRQQNDDFSSTKR